MFDQNKAALFTIFISLFVTIYQIKIVDFFSRTVIIRY